jgi:hypothetical protein
MRVIWLRKKVVEYEPSVRERGLVVYHGTNLPNLYLILESGKLGSEAGRHTGFYRRVGKFYMTDSKLVADDYAEDAARDPTYYVPGHRLPDERAVKESASSLQKLMEVFKATGIYDLYVKFASFLRFHGLYRVPVYPKVIIELVIKQPEVLDKVYFDEDLFTSWLSERFNDAEIVEAAIQDPKFFAWVRKICPRCSFPLTPNKLAWELASPSYDEPTYGGEDDEYYYEEEDDESEPAKEEEDLPPAPSFFPEEFHEVAKRIYRALIRLADEGWNRDIARGILEEFKRDWEARKAAAGSEETAWSYFIQDYIPLESIDEATATVYLDSGTIEINLKDPGALQKVEEIMVEQILQWARTVTS